MGAIEELRDDEIVDFYNNKEDWNPEEIEQFEYRLVKLCQDNKDLFYDIEGFNDSGYGKYVVENMCFSDWGLDDFYNGKRYSTWEIVKWTTNDGTNPYIYEFDELFVVDLEGLMSEFKKNIGVA